MTTSSIFVNELIKENYDIELNEFEITPDQKITQNFYCIKCQTGIMQPKVNRTKKTTFYGCSHYSLCKHTENGCSKCGSRMIRINENNSNYRVCSNCTNWMPLCATCGGDMVPRKGPYSLFWGCSHFYGKEEPLTCQYTINIKKVETPKGYENVVNATNNVKQKIDVKSNKVEEVWDDNKFTDRKDAYTYASKLAKTKKSTVNVIEGDGYWLVELKNR